nr:MAG TPA: Ellis van Creveld protein 2 like protein [Caudoviricetes sp.]
MRSTSNTILALQRNPEGFFHNRKVCKMWDDFYFFTLIGWVAAGFFLGIIVGATCT